MTVQETMYRKQMVKVINHLDTELKSQQQRGAVSRDVVFREYANGRRLFNEDWAEQAIGHYGPGGRIEVALDRLLAEFRGLYDRRTAGMTVALTRNEAEHMYFFVFVYIQP
ncbi:MAG: hypothetical protein ACOH18_02320 [Candidatus Saccharimonadaceae bacterium]